MSKGYQEPTEGAASSRRWNNWSNKINEVVLGYTPNYKVNIHVSALIKISVMENRQLSLAEEL